MNKTGALSAKQTAVIAALLETRTVADAAAKTGTPARTIYRWLLDPDFQQALQVAESLVIDAAVRRLLVLQQTALNTLDEVMQAPDASPTARVAASKAVLDTLLDYREQRTFEERLTALERASAMEDV